MTSAGSAHGGSASIQLLAAVSDELQVVEERLRLALASRESLLTEIGSYLVLSGGKRVRPAVAVLVYRACGGSDAQLGDIVDVAVALELIHSASLLHDDIIDGSEFRRGRDSAFRKFGPAATLVAGDFLFGQAYQICARFDEKLIQWAVRACIALTEGEIMQGRFRHNGAVTLPDYLEIVSRKTASLFQAGARTAAFLAGAGEAEQEAMAAAGEHVGLTFQIIDDVLDITGELGEIGKPVGIDLRDGNPSLPVVLAMQDSEAARHLFEKRELDDAEIATLLDLLRQSPAIAQARSLGREHAERSRQALLSLPDSEYRRHLVALVDQLVDRVA